jgi:hypothetical protein
MVQFRLAPRARSSPTIAAPHFTVLRNSTLPGFMRPLPLGWAPSTSVLFSRS